MFTYHVYFTPKENLSHEEVSDIIERFADHEMNNNFLEHYQLFRFTNKAAFPDLMDYHFTANYKTQADFGKAMKDMGTRINEEPHLSIMKMCKAFGVAFSERIEKHKNAEQDGEGNS
ncbi:hypothetical protein [Rubritalea sp.]|uniref:hypothetical protein n=1 Tax=Rubritalea sp. TaxID=2109375 RepID=UPI003EFB1DC7